MSLNNICNDCLIDCDEEDIEIARCEHCREWLCEYCIDDHICKELIGPVDDD